MSEGVKPRRQYRSSARTRQREATREAVIDAAAAAFVGNGYAATTIARIAKGAEVSPETVYAVFGTKRDLLRAVIERASTGAPGTEVWRQDWLARVDAEDNQRRRLELITDATRDVLRRVAPIDEIVRSVEHPIRRSLSYRTRSNVAASPISEGSCNCSPTLASSGCRLTRRWTYGGPSCAVRALIGRSQ